MSTRGISLLLVVLRGVLLGGCKTSLQKAQSNHKGTKTLRSCPKTTSYFYN